jgi:hypothetical protein
LKVCSRCKVAKDRIYFNRNRAQKDGLQTSCKPCHSAAVTASKLRHLPAKVGEIRARIADGGAVRPKPVSVTACTRGNKPMGTETKRALQELGEAAFSRIPAVVTPAKPSIDVFVCERGQGSTICICGNRKNARCGFPHQGSKCNAPICDKCGHEIRKGLKYCGPHHERAMAAVEAAKRRAKA